MKGYSFIHLLAAGVVAVSPHASAAARPADGRLAYVQYADAGCKVGLWDSKSGASKVMGSLPECPEAVSVTSHEQALVLIFPASIRLVDLSSGKVGDAILLPAEAVSKTRDTTRSLAGHMPDGSLALSVRDYAPKYGVVGRLFLYKDGAWKKTADQPCDEYEDCPFQASIQARQLDDAYGVGPDGLFNESLTKDPYVVGRSVKAPHADEAEDEEEESD